MSSEKLLDLRDVSHRYLSSSTKVVEQANLSVGSGDTVLVTGASGSGKTTLMMIAAGLMKPTCGQVIFRDTPLYELSHRARAQIRRQHMGFMVPSFRLLPYLTAEDNLKLAGSKRPDEKRHREELLERTGLLGHRYQRASQLSTGEQRRLMLCRALVGDPDLLFCDEPIANLDDENAKIVVSLIEDFAHGNKAALVISHDSLDAFGATQHVSMNHGRLVTTSNGSAH